MDLTRAVTYRDFLLNDPTTLSNTTGGGDTGTGIEGCVVDSVDFSDVDVIQWIEKRSQGDGMDAGDAFLGTRRLRMAGTLYEKTRSALFDRLWDLRATLNPVLAQREEPLDKGYRPIYFSTPTEREEFEAGIIELQMKVMPRAFQTLFDRDQSGGDDDDALAIPWQATFLAKDPGIYGRLPVDVEFDAMAIASGTSIGTNDIFNDVGHGLVAGDRVTFSAAAGGGVGLTLGVAYYVRSGGLTADAFTVSETLGGAALDITTAYTTFSYVKSVTVADEWTNRGTYLGKFNAVIEVGAGAGSIEVTVGDSSFTVNIPASTVNRIIRIKDDKVLTVEEVETTPEALQMSYIVFNGDTTWPLIDPGVTPYSFTFHGMSGVKDGSHAWFYEQYA